MRVCLSGEQVPLPAGTDKVQESMSDLCASSFAFVADMCLPVWYAEDLS